MLNVSWKIRSILKFILSNLNLHRFVFHIKDNRIEIYVFVIKILA